MKYTTEKELIAVVRAFENGTISRELWGHPEHLIVALYYILNTTSFAEALNKMRGGIFDLLKAFEIDLSIDMPYHETLTVFWLETVAGFAESKKGCAFFEICNELFENFGKDFPLRFYSRELLFSDEARQHFVKPDLETINKKFPVDYKSVTNQN